MLSNQKIRTMLLEYIKNNGVKQKYLATQIGVSEATISLFLKEKRMLSSTTLKTIDDLLNK